MKTLLYKQLRLVCHPMTPVFCLFGFMVIIPNYPYTVIFFYVMLGLFFTFLNMREQKDLYYTALLPVPKRDAVKAGCLFTALIELLSLATPCPEFGEPVTLHLAVRDLDDLRGALKPDAGGRSLRGDATALRRRIDADDAGNVGS